MHARLASRGSAQLTVLGAGAGEAAAPGFRTVTGHGAGHGEGHDRTAGRPAGDREHRFERQGLSLDSDTVERPLDPASVIRVRPSSRRKPPDR